MALEKVVYLYRNRLYVVNDLLPQLQLPESITSRTSDINELTVTMSGYLSL